MAHLIQLEFKVELQGKVISAILASGKKKKPGCLTSFQSWKKTVNCRHRGIDELGKDLALDSFPFLKVYLKIINRNDWDKCRVIIRIKRICDRCLRYWFRSGTSNVTPQFAAFDKDNHILRPRMIRSGSIKNNSDGMCDVMT